MPLLPSDGIRRVISTLAGGVLLPGGLGIKDPCEKDNTDAFASLSLQGNGLDFIFLSQRDSAVRLAYGHLVRIGDYHREDTLHFSFHLIVKLSIAKTTFIAAFFINDWIKMAQNLHYFSKPYKRPRRSNSFSPTCITITFIRCNA